MTEQAHKTNYNEIFYWLVGLAAISVIGSVFHLPVKLVNALVFGIAFVKASLVAWNFMHLKSEGRLIYMIALIPVVLFIILVTLLVPDFLVRKNAIPPPPSSPAQVQP